MQTKLLYLLMNLFLYIIFIETSGYPIVRTVVQHYKVLNAQKQLEMVNVQIKLNTSNDLWYANTSAPGYPRYI